MKRNIVWNLYIRDIDHNDDRVCAASYQDGDLSDFLAKFVDISDFGMDCFIEVEVYYTKEENE